MLPAKIKGQWLRADGTGPGEESARRPRCHPVGTGVPSALSSPCPLHARTTEFGGYRFGPTIRWIASSFWLLLLLSSVVASMPIAFNAPANAMAAGIRVDRNWGLTSIDTLFTPISPYRWFPGQPFFPNTIPPIQSICTHPAFEMAGSKLQRKSQASRSTLACPTSNLVPENGMILATSDASSSLVGKLSKFYQL
jgi:hypothetical protein